MDIPQSFRKVSEKKTEQLLKGPKMIDKEDYGDGIKQVFPNNLGELTNTWKKIPVEGDDFDGLSEIIEDYTFMVRSFDSSVKWATRLTYYTEGGDVWVRLPWYKSRGMPVEVYVRERPHVSEKTVLIEDLVAEAEKIIGKINQQFLTYLKKK